MTTEIKIERINELNTAVQSANTATTEGRHTVANSCSELYQLIEEDVYKAGSEWMLKGMYNDLCKGNFAEPYMCERKKTDFATAKKVYEEKIVTRL